MKVQDAQQLTSGELAMLNCLSLMSGSTSHAHSSGTLTALNSSSTSAMVRRTRCAYSYMSSAPSPGVQNSSSFSRSMCPAGAKCRICSKKDRRGTEKGDRCEVSNSRSVRCRGRVGGSGRSRS